MSPTDPGNLLRLRDSIYASDLFIASVGHLNLFTRLDKNPSTIRDICFSLEIKERPTDVMLTLLKALNLLEERNECYYLTEISQEYLTESSSLYLGPYISSLKDRDICIQMLNVLKTGKPASWGAKKDEKEWAQAMERDDFAESFTDAMDSRGRYLASAMMDKLDFSDYHNLLDIAGGSGIYAATILSENKHMSASVLEKSPVDKVVEYAIKKRGMDDRIKVISRDMFKDDFPEGFDVHLFSNVLHDWNINQVEMLIKNSYRNLKTGGMIIIHDAHLNAEKTGPLPVAEYSVLLMFSTEGRCYSVREIEKILSETGFSDVKYNPTTASRSIITGRKR